MTAVPATYRHTNEESLPRPGSASRPVASFFSSLKKIFTGNTTPTSVGKETLAQHWNAEVSSTGMPRLVQPSKSSTAKRSALKGAKTAAATAAAATSSKHHHGVQPEASGASGNDDFVYRFSPGDEDSECDEPTTPRHRSNAAEAGASKMPAGGVYLTAAAAAAAAAAASSKAGGAREEEYRSPMRRRSVSALPIETLDDVEDVDLTSHTSPKQQRLQPDMVRTGSGKFRPPTRLMSSSLAGSPSGELVSPTGGCASQFQAGGSATSPTSATTAVAGATGGSRFSEMPTYKRPSAYDRDIPSPGLSGDVGGGSSGSRFTDAPTHRHSSGGLAGERESSSHRGASRLADAPPAHRYSAEVGSSIGAHLDARQSPVPTSRRRHSSIGELNSSGPSHPSFLADSSPSALQRMAAAPPPPAPQPAASAKAFMSSHILNMLGDEASSGDVGSRQGSPATGMYDLPGQPWSREASRLEAQGANANSSDDEPGEFDCGVADMLAGLKRRDGKPIDINNVNDGPAPPWMQKNKYLTPAFGGLMSNPEGRLDGCGGDKPPPPEEPMTVAEAVAARHRRSSMSNVGVRLETEVRHRRASDVSGLLAPPPNKDDPYGMLGPFKPLDEELIRDAIKPPAKEPSEVKISAATTEFSARKGTTVWRAVGSSSILARDSRPAAGTKL